ncbi:hypothetical protein PO878_08290 [Iamia majanohamensis]|uniref:Nucleotidyltransferase family protein n=1 Tax=Iamia majanohamensis TaxID=467976 RepID=A0AAF0BXH2_9ACTN|nr:hypothetical protein [Iamia majanohamensis]WCO68724.1 hypothetical protein PO878_08290 [Iamia majanohamensis]
MSALADKVVALHGALDAARHPHAFGGALALAWCTQRARGTIDIDLNVFVDAARAASVVEALPGEVAWSEAHLRLLEGDGQARLWWGGTPVDVFLDTTDFHRDAATRARTRPFGGAQVPFLGCSDLAVFKAFFSRTKDWADLEEMWAAGTLDLDRVVGVLVRYLGAEDERVARLLALAT